MLRGTRRWLGRGLALGVANALAFAGCGSDGTSAASACRTWCERLVASGCETEETPTDARDCPAVCAATVDTECAVELQAVMRCAASAPFECVPGMCDPEGFCTGDRVELQGCEAQQQVYADCDDPGCSDLGGFGRFMSEDGTEGTYSYESDCGECPPSIESGEPGAPCSAAETDCSPICCACESFRVSVRACLGGVCAEEADACGPEIDACGEF